MNIPLLSSSIHSRFMCGQSNYHLLFLLLGLLLHYYSWRANHMKTLVQFCPPINFASSRRFSGYKKCNQQREQSKPYDLNKSERCITSIIDTKLTNASIGNINELKLNTGEIKYNRRNKC